MTDRYAVIGNPVAHSKSPRIHAEFARQTKQDISYDAIHAAIDDFETEARRFAESGGRGMNVTLPFKHRAFALAGELTHRAEAANAVNTLSFDRQRIDGDNTDGVGLIRDITRNIVFEIRGKRLLLMGAGGAAYGVCGPLLDEAPASLTIANRTPGKALALRDRFTNCTKPGTAIDTVRYENLGATSFDLVINATSAGLGGAMPALPARLFNRGALAYDMVYGETHFLEFARDLGARASNGLGMLVEQAAESFFVWRGVRPDTAPVIAMLRSAA